MTLEAGVGRRGSEKDETAVRDTVLSSFPFVVRPMQETDIPAVMAIERRSFPSPWPESAYRYELRYRVNSRFYVLEPSGGEEPQPVGFGERLQWALQHQEAPPILGYLGLRLRAAEVHICTIAVHPDWRGQGLGDLLLLLALETALRHGARRVTLEVRPSNRVAQRLYAKVGFVRVEVRRSYYRDGEDAWVMALELLDEACAACLQDLREAVEARLVAESSVHTGR